MKKIFCPVLFLSLALWSPTFAASNELIWSIKTSVFSEYIGKIGAIFHEDPILVNDINLSYGDWYAGIWNSTGLGSEKYGSTFGDEFDLYAGWGHTYDWVRLDISASYFFLKNLDRVRDDLWVVDAEVGFPKVPVVQPYIAGRYFGMVSSESFERGWFGFAGLRRSQPLGFRLGKTENLSLKFDLSTAYSDGALGKDPGFVFARLTAGLPIALSKRATLIPSILYQIPVGGQRGNEKRYVTGDELVYGLSLKLVF